MEFIEYLKMLASDYTLRTISLGTALMGVSCGLLGSFAVLRKQSLLGDAISHAALPGIAIAFLLTGVKDPVIFFAGAVASGIIGTLWVMSITKKTHLKTDTALGLVLSVFFGIGMMLLTIIQKQPNANQAGLDSYLFGQAATLVVDDVWLMLAITLLALIFLLLFWKEFKILAFDQQYAQAIGFNTKLLDMLLTSLIVLAIVLGLQTVGVVLMSAMLLAPAAAARQWTNKLGLMVTLAASFGALAGVSGTAISASVENLATGPVIVLVAVAFVVVSIFFAPGRGVLYKHLVRQRNRRDLRLNKTLALMYEIAKEHSDYSHPHSVKILNNFQGFRRKCMRKLEMQELITLKDNSWMFTAKGYEKAGELNN